MSGSRVVLEPGFEIDALPFGVLEVDRDGTIKSFKPFTGAAPSIVNDGMIGQNFFSDVMPYAQMRRFHERFWTFAASQKPAVEPFELTFSGRSEAKRVSVLFVRDEEIDGRVSIVVMKNGDVQ